MMTPARLFTAIGLGLASAGGALYLLRDNTTDNDQTGEDVGKIDVPRGATGLGARAVEVLNRHVGEREQGGKNRGPLVDRINAGLYNDAPQLIGKAWCARAGRWAYEKAAQELGMGKPFAKKLGALSWVSDWKKGPLKDYVIKEPKVGAALLLKGDQHLALVAKLLGGLSVVTVEGNHGDAIANVKRTIDPGKDVLVDVEAYVRDAQRGVTAAGLAMLGATLHG